MPIPPDAPQSALPRGRLSRRAVGAFATGGIAAGIAMHAGPALAKADPVSSQLNADGTTPFNLRLSASAPALYAGGTARTASVTEMPRLSGLSMLLVEIEPGAVREVHWHPNATEISYVLHGEGIIGILSTSGDNAIFPVTEGTSTVVPRGDAHYIQNTGTDILTLLIGFANADPLRLTVSQTLPWIPANVLDQTFGVPTGTLSAFPPRGDLAIVPLPKPLPESDETLPETVDSPYSAPLSALAVAQFGGGTVQALRTDVVPKLADMTLLRLVVDAKAVREPHWHGNAAEFNYCAHGSAQVGIVAPTGESWTFTMGEGDVAFIPDNWFHYIANIDTVPLEIIAFFDAVAPSRIDLSTMAGFFPPEVLAASLDVSPDVFANLPKEGTVVIAPPVPEVAPEGTPAS